MNTNEYQAKDILKHCEIPIQPGRLVHTPGEALKTAEELHKPSRFFAVKAQVHASRSRNGQKQILTM